jgi:anti-anti-sigma factor
VQYHISASADGLTLRLIGRFTHADRSLFVHALGELEGASPKQLTCDLSEVVFIDSAGLGMLLMVRERLEAWGGTVALRGIQGQVAKLIGLTRFDQMFLMEA